MFNFLSKKTHMVDAANALPGRPDAIPTAATHFVNKRALKGPYPQDTETAIFGMGCFWGAERKFWQAGESVYVTAAGYAGGVTPNPTYEETCTGLTGHTVALQAGGVPHGWVASFCTDRVCAPFKTSVVLPNSGVKVIEFQLIPPDAKARLPKVRVTGRDGGRESSATT